MQQFEPFQFIAIRKLNENSRVEAATQRLGREVRNFRAERKVFYGEGTRKFCMLT